MAAKIIPMKNYGQPDLLEASIMCSYEHPSLTRAKYVHTERGKMYIIQELATDNVARYIKNQVPTELVLHSWCLALAQAVACLHNERIIHCDIKGANALRYHDNRVSLADFTLATLASHNDEYFKHMICTVSHRPPEVMAGEYWTFSVDIWSLGITFYEISTGELLVPYQGRNISNKLRTDLRKQQINERALAAITLWAQSRGDAKALRFNTKIRDVIQVELSPHFLQLKKEFQELVLWMLTFDPEKRPTITEVLAHPYFNTTMAPYTIVSTPTSEVPADEVRMLERIASKYNLPSNVLQKTKELYSRCTKMKEARSFALVQACIWVAYKVMTGVHLEGIELQLHQIVELERLVCRHLGYRLHVASTPSSTCVDAPIKRPVPPSSLKPLRKH